MSTLDESFFELRLYSIAPGRLDDMAARFREDLSTLFPKHGIHPLAGFTASSGAGMPKFVYIMPWDSLAQRSQALAGFAGDPAWAEVRDRTNGPSELVERYDIYFLKAMLPVEPVPQHQSPGRRVYELALQTVSNGQLPDMRQTMHEVEIPAYQVAGARLVGAFEIFCGPALPSVVTLMSWESVEARAQGLQKLQANPSLQAARQQQIATLGRCVLGHADRYLLNLVPVDWDRS